MSSPRGGRIGNLLLAVGSLVVFFGTELPIVLVDNWLVSLLIFGAVIAMYWRIASRGADGE